MNRPSTTTRLEELIRTRRTISTFSDQPIDVALIESLLETAVWTPNHRLTEPWRFILITDEGVKGYASIRSEMAISIAATPEQITAKDAVFQKFANVPAYLVVALRTSPNPEIAEEDYGACCALIQNFLLLAWEQGIGTAWKTFKNDPRLRAFIGLNADERVAGIIQIGYPSETPVSERRSIQDRITTIR